MGGVTLDWSSEAGGSEDSDAPRGCTMVGGRDVDVEDDVDVEVEVKIESKSRSRSRSMPASGRREDSEMNVVSVVTHTIGIWYK